MLCKRDRRSCKVTSVTPVRQNRHVQLRAMVGIHGACHQRNAGQVSVAKLNGISTKVCVLVYFLSESCKKMEVEDRWRHRRGGKNQQLL